VVQRVSEQVDETCRELGISIVGGHTEMTAAVVQPVLIGE
jgi:hydrogenase maturation factor